MGKSLAIHREIEKHKLNSFQAIKKHFEAAPYHCKVRVDDERQLYLLMYDQVKTQFVDNPAAHETRGIVLCKKTNQVVCYAFDKFFNHGEKAAAKIDWDSACFYEKCDGSLMKVYNHKDEWIVGTNGTIDASTARTACKQTFRQLFDEAAAQSGFSFDALDKNCTYMFELLHPNNVIVVRHEQPSLRHLGTRNNLTLEENRDFIGVPQPKVFDFDSLQQCVDAVKNFDSTQEGVVVCDQNYARVKVKGHVYLRLHYTLTSVHMTPPQMAARIFLSGEQNEIAAYSRENSQIDHVSALVGKLEKHFDEWCRQRVTQFIGLLEQQQCGDVDRKKFVQVINSDESLRADRNLFMRLLAEERVFDQRVAFARDFVLQAFRGKDKVRVAKLDEFLQKIDFKQD